MEQSFLRASRQACLSKAHSAAAARISGQWINLVWPGNLRKFRKVVSPPNLPHGTPDYRAPTLFPGVPEVEQTLAEALWEKTVRACVRGGAAGV
eukprot:125800-Chlamydomonas_euryale.AAC.2